MRVDKRKIIFKLAQIIMATMKAMDKDKNMQCSIVNIFKGRIFLK